MCLVELSRLWKSVIVGAEDEKKKVVVGSNGCVDTERVVVREVMLVMLWKTIDCSARPS